MFFKRRVTTKVVLQRSDGVPEIRKIYRAYLKEPYIWDDYIVGVFEKESQGGFLYFKEVTNFDELDTGTNQTS